MGTINPDLSAYTPPLVLAMTPANGQSGCFAPGQRHAVAEAVTIWLSPAPIFFHVPDWHWPPCQSGVWRTSGSSNGSYSNLGSPHRILHGNLPSGANWSVYACWRKVNFRLGGSIICPMKTGYVGGHWRLSTQTQ